MKLIKTLKTFTEEEKYIIAYSLSSQRDIAQHEFYKADEKSKRTLFLFINRIDRIKEKLNEMD